VSLYFHGYGEKGLQFQMILRILLTCFLFFYASNVQGMFEDNNKCKWEEKNSMPTSRSEFSSVTDGKNIYVLGGIKESKALSNFEIYNSTTDAWRELSSLPISVHHGAIGIVNNKIYLIGGFTDVTWTRPNKHIFEYDIQNDLWKKYDELLITRVGHTLEVVDNQILIIGGHGYKPSRILKYNITNKKISEIDSMMPSPADHLASIIYNDNIIILGGRNGSGNLNVIRIFKLKKNQWLYNDGLPFSISGHIAEIVDNKIHLAGGENIDKNITSKAHWIFDIKKNKWEESIDLPLGLHGLGSGIIDNTLYIFGGASEAGKKTYNSTQNKIYLLKC
jgi:N-acetylneuraminic acid mutarotase